MKAGGWLACSGEYIYAAKGNKTGEFYRYKPAVGEWETRSSMPAGETGLLPEKGSKGVGDGRRFIYATKGNKTAEFWRYNTQTDSWDQRASVPGEPYQAQVKDGADLVYVGVGDTGYVYLLKGYKKEFWRYNTAAGNWQKLADAPGDKGWKSGSWLTYDSAGTIYAHKGRIPEFYRYDVATGNWDTILLRPIPTVGAHGKSRKTGKGGGSVFASGYIYALKGNNTGETWKYFISRDSWYLRDTILKVGTSGRKKGVGGGGDIVCWESWSTIYALKGNGVLEFWRASWYEPANDGEATSIQDGVPFRLHITPNPVASSFAMVSCGFAPTGPVRIDVIDAGGRAVRSFCETGRSSFPIDTRSLPAGIYLVKLTERGFTATQKLVVQR